MRGRYKCLQIKLLCCLVFLCLQISPCAADDFRGYQVNLEVDPPKPVIKALIRQLEICDRAPVSERLHSFFKSIPIFLIPNGPGTVGRYWNGRITLRMRPFPDKPILLHEMLHAVHNQLVPNGVNNQDISNFYLKARDAFTQIDPDDSEDYFLKNDREFFAVTASIYLFGDIARPPYSMRNIEQSVPGYAAYLQNLFAQL